MNELFKKVFIIGAGQIGSRHLQALKAVKMPLEILVIDPTAVSLEMAKSRYESATAGKFAHSINFVTRFPEVAGAVDLAIIATSSDNRADAVRRLFKSAKVKNLVLEKLLFQKPVDYEDMAKLLKKAEIKVWVNCCMRMMVPYRAIKNSFTGKQIYYTISGSLFGLITNAIHYIDHMVYLTGSTDFKVVTDFLDSRIIPSKRKGFLELTGTLLVQFKNGSEGAFTCYRSGDAPVVVQIYSKDARYLGKESEGKAWFAESKRSWKWREIDAPIPFQSQMTTELVESILEIGKCLLPAYEESAKIHLKLLEPLRLFLNKHSGKKYDHYPFT